VVLVRLDRLGVEDESVVRAFMRGPDESDVLSPPGGQGRGILLRREPGIPPSREGECHWPVGPLLDGTMHARQELKTSLWLGADRPDGMA
jgi:hypothetical protein